MTSDGEVLVQFRQPQRPLWWPVTNFFYQPYLETKLGDALVRHPNVEVRRGREVIEFDQDADGVTVVHATSTGSGYGKQDNVIDDATR
ncbi:bifunctional 3-(3-hydroxy-phenyl)propionate/3-hydroxycinnamic acid hydroxylase, partial [Mycobacterium kansasii]